MLLAVLSGASRTIAPRAAWAATIGPQSPAVAFDPFDAAAELPVELPAEPPVAQAVARANESENKNNRMAVLLLAQGAAVAWASVRAARAGISGPNIRVDPAAVKPGFRRRLVLDGRSTQCGFRVAWPD
jgi:hypothetical protein